MVVPFIVAMAALGVAWLSPLEALGDIRFSAHMAQQELIMLVAAPLLAIALPLPPRWRRLFILEPAVAFSLHAMALWLWHAPQLLEGALQHEGLRAIERASLLFTAALFWSSVIHGNQRLASLFVLATGVHTGLLGALLAVAGRVWYPRYVSSLGVDALQDQRLAGLVMWIPGGALFLMVGLALFSASARCTDIRIRACVPGWASAPSS